MLADLEAALAEKGQCLPFEPPRFAQGGTVGGMVAAGLAGPARAAVGGVRDYVLGAKLLNGRAELLGFEGVTFQSLLGYAFAPVFALLGTASWAEAQHAGALFGTNGVVSPCR